MLKVLGIDLAGKEQNPTGICRLQKDMVECSIIYSNKEIRKVSNDFKPSIIAVDAPLMDGEPRVRKADQVLKTYGALPPSMPGMKRLTQRASTLAEYLDRRYKVIEVFPTATAKILGVYHKDYRKTATCLDVDVENKHEVDAYLCALTAQLFLQGNTFEVGDEEGTIVVPKH